jgi:hypothetical protein
VLIAKIQKARPVAKGEKIKNEQSKMKRIMRKIWYGIAIALSVLVLLLSTAGVIGSWFLEQTLVDVTQNLMGAVAGTAGGLRRVVAQIDQGVGEVRQIANGVSFVSQRIGQNVEDKGLILTLLPADQEQKLVERIDQLQDKLSSIREILAAGLSMYRSIDRLPFVNLPRPGQESAENIEQTMAESRASVLELRQNVQDFRSNVTGGVGKITQAADRVTERMDGLHDQLTELDQNMAALQDFAVRVQNAVPFVFGLGAILLTLLMVYVIYSQVEIICLLIGRWKKMNLPQIEANSQPPIEANNQ